LAGLGSRESIAAHAQKLLNEAVDSGRILPDSAAATANAIVPSFSAGTVAIDPNTGRPAGIHEPSTPAIDSTSTVEIPESTDADAGSAQEAQAAGTRERDASGRFTGDKPAETPAPAPAKPTVKPAAKPRTPDAKAAAAEAAAGEILDDEWADAEDMTFEHDDGSRYPVRTPKKYAKQVARFNERQAQKDRAAAWLGRYRPTLEPLITGGRLDGILPHIQRALQDPAFADYVSQGYNRIMLGQPLVQTAPQVVAQPSPGQISPAATAAPALPEITDPFIAEAVGPVLAPLMAQLRAQQAEIDGWKQQQQTAAQTQAQETARQNQQRAQLAAGHADLSQKYPASFRSDLGSNDPEWERVFRYARDGGYFQTYTDPRAAIRIAGDDYLASRADTHSPAAAMLNRMDQATLRAANAQAASARAVTGGAPAHVPKPAKPKPPEKPNPRDATGKLKNTRDFMRESQSYAETLAAASA
jgi:hypothetical protein